MIKILSHQRLPLRMLRFKLSRILGSFFEGYLSLPRVILNTLTFSEKEQQKLVAKLSRQETKAFLRNPSLSENALISIIKKWIEPTLGEESTLMLEELLKSPNLNAEVLKYLLGTTNDHYRTLKIVNAGGGDEEVFNALLDKWEEEKYSFGLSLVVEIALKRGTFDVSTVKKLFAKGYPTVERAAGLAKLSASIEDVKTLLLNCPEPFSEAYATRDDLETWCVELLAEKSERTRELLAMNSKVFPVSILPVTPALLRRESDQVDAYINQHKLDESTFWALAKTWEGTFGELRAACLELGPSKIR